MIMQKIPKNGMGRYFFSTQMYTFRAHIAESETCDCLFSKERSVSNVRKKTYKNWSRGDVHKIETSKPVLSVWYSLRKRTKANAGPKVQMQFIPIKSLCLAKRKILTFVRLQHWKSPMKNFHADTHKCPRNQLNYKRAPILLVKCAVYVICILWI